MAGTAEQCRINAQRSTGPKTATGKAKVAKNRLSHGLRVENPALLPTEDYTNFQEMVQGLADQYEPQGPVEWHLVQTVAMCMIKQHRAWISEAAIGKSHLLPQPEQPERVEKYPTTRAPKESLSHLKDDRTQNHPEELAQERVVLETVIEALNPELIPEYSRSKYFQEEWQEWQDDTVDLLKKAYQEYPLTGVEGYPPRDVALLGKEAALKAHRKFSDKLDEQGHPSSVVIIIEFLIKELKCPKNKGENRAAERLSFYTPPLYSRLKEINAIEAEQCEAEAEYRRRLVEYQSSMKEYHKATTGPIDARMTLIHRYSTANENQLYRALEKLEELVSKRVPLV